MKKNKIKSLILNIKNAHKKTLLERTFKFKKVTQSHV